MKSFIKDEAYGSFKHVRGIYSRVDIFKCMFGPLIKAIEDVIYELPYFIKHIPVQQRPKFVFDRLYRENATYVSTDYTAFESHFTRQMMEACEFQLYRHMYQYLPKKPIYDKLLEVISGRNIVQFKWLTAKFNARRMSGEMNTSLGNGFTNLMVFLFLNRNTKDFDCVIEGDDCLGRVSVIPTTEQYRDMGFNVKIETTTDLSTAAFCSMYFDVESFVTVVDPIKTIMKLGWVSARYVGCSLKKKRELLHGKVLSMMSEASGAPMIDAFGKRMLYLLRNYHFRFDYMSTYEKERLNLGFEHREVTMQSRCLVEKAFGITIAEQLSFERYCQTFDIGPIMHPVIYERTTADQREFFDIYVAPYKVGKNNPVLRVPQTIGQC